MNINSRGRAVHELQQDAETSCHNINANKDKNIEVITIKLLTFNNVTSLIISRLESRTRYK